MKVSRGTSHGERRSSRTLFMCMRLTEPDSIKEESCEDSGRGLDELLGGGGGG